MDRHGNCSRLKKRASEDDHLAHPRLGRRDTGLGQDTRTSRPRKGDGVLSTGHSKARAEMSVTGEAAKPPSIYHE